MRYVEIHAANMASSRTQVNYANLKLVSALLLSPKCLMPSLARITVHPSQFPDQVRRDLLASLRTRRLNHKFLYDSVKQTQQWLALHQACSPSRTDPACAAAYDHAFAATATRFPTPRLHLIGLGCGGGQKDARLLKRLQDSGSQVSYTPVDVSTAMVLVARDTVLNVIPDDACSPLVCDLASPELDLPHLLDDLSIPGAARLLTFFGMLPNFEPQVILPRLAALVQPSDALLLSANLAPGSDYTVGVEKILPLYDNALTRDWLMTFLLDLGVERADGQLAFRIEEDPAGYDLKRVAAYFQFLRPGTIQVDSERFEFPSGDAIRLFFSYRHTPDRIDHLLRQHGLQVRDQWITPSQEEGVFLVTRRLEGS
jgi:L-histidine Nalpha-methyltransferase